MVEVEVRCDQCGNTRTTWNDPRKGGNKGMIECKAKCFETHPNWTFVREVSTAPPALPAAVASPVREAPDCDNRGHSPTDDNRPGPAKRGFAEEEAKPATPAAPPPKKEEACCVVM